MIASGSRIAHWPGKKEAPHHVRALLGATKVASQVPHQLPLRPGPPSAHRVGLHILVQVLPRVQFRTISRKMDQPNPLLVPLHPLCYRLRHVHWMAVHDEVHLPIPGPYQPPQKVDEQRRGETLLKDSEPEDATVGHSRDHVAPEPLARGRHHRSLPFSTPGPSYLVVRPGPHLIAPVDLRPFLLGLFLDLRVLLQKPAPYRSWVLFISTAGWLLGSKAPPLEVSPHRPLGERQAQPPLDQFPYCLSSPEKKGQPQLVWRVAAHQLQHHSCLLLIKGRMERSPLGTRVSPYLTLLAVKPHPPGHCAPGHTKELGCLLMCPSL